MQINPNNGFLGMLKEWELKIGLGDRRLDQKADLRYLRLRTEANDKENIGFDGLKNNRTKNNSSSALKAKLCDSDYDKQLWK